MSTQLENELHFDNPLLQQHLSQYYRAILRDFRKVTKSFVSFHLLFSALLAGEITLFFVSLPFLSKSSILAFALGGIFLTGFLYVVLLFYFQAKKPEQFTQLRDQFIQSCHQILHSNTAQNHLSTAEALSNLSSYLHEFERNFYQIPKLLTPLTSLISRFSEFCYSEDVFKMKTLLLQAAIDAHLKQIRHTPTDLEVHASLANSYIALSKIYSALSQNSQAGWQKKYQSLFEEKFRDAAKLAIEEFRILSHYAPNDPWVHEQLALGYRDLGMPEEEVREVETLLKLRPQDKEILFRLGTIYFEQGQNAKGLQIYEQLKQANFKKAEDLIAIYGTFRK